MLKIKKKAVITRLDLKVGYACNNDCLFCVTADKRKFGQDTTTKLKDKLTQAFKEGKKEVVFTGGECLIRPDIIEIVSFAHKLGYVTIQIQSNGRKFAAVKFCCKLQNAGMTEAGISIHGHNAKIHDFLTSRRGSWRQTVLGINNLKKIKTKVLTNSVITKQNFKYLPQLSELLIKLKVDMIQFAFIHINGNAMVNYKKIVPKMTQIMPSLKIAIDLCREASVRAVVEAVPLCVLGDYKGYAAEFFVPAVEVHEIYQNIKDFQSIRRNKAKTKFSKCHTCKLNDQCEGTWREYSELFGDKEFKPVC